MKTKLFMVLLTVLFIVPISEVEAKKDRKNVLLRNVIEIMRQNKTRTLINYDINVSDDGNNLQILFQFPLSDADITVTDKNGNIVINERQTLIYEGQMLYVYNSDNYPYNIEITSPTIDITGEIVLEEE